jgi:hypothetical protein
MHFMWRKYIFFRLLALREGAGEKNSRGQAKRARRVHNLQTGVIGMGIVKRAALFRETDEGIFLLRSGQKTAWNELS